MSDDPKFQALRPRRMSPTARIGLAGVVLAMMLSQTALAAMPDLMDMQRPVARTMPAAATELALLKKTSPAKQAQAPACGADTLQAVLSTADKSPVLVGCSLTLPKGKTVRRQILMEGSAASNAVLDCGGSTIDTSDGTSRDERMALIIRSKQVGTDWQPPSNVLVKNCTIIGATRVYGLGINAGAAPVRASSMNKNHTMYAQAMAPKGVVFDHVVFHSLGPTPLYVGPGVTGLILQSSILEGQTNTVAIYLDAESAHSQIIDNTFSITTRRRELIAIDGSAHNIISGNTFESMSNGGIFLYRNCGEKGTIRQQKPQYNLISDNTFKYGSGSRQRPAVFLNSRAGKQRYCFNDPAHPYGSSANPMDFAQFNKVVNNTVIGSQKNRNTFRNDDSTNTISGNKFD